MTRTIEFSKGKMPLKIGFYTLKHFQKETKKDLALSLDSLSYEEMELLFYLAYVNGCKAGAAEGWDVKYTREEIEMIYDEVMSDFLHLIPDLVSDTFDLDKKKSNQSQVTKKKAKA
jgi:hypothetical protein